ncbi:MAG: hypothetical protein ACOVN9_09925 [Inhella sp.]
MKIDTDEGVKEYRVEIERVHMEEDTGKSLHMGGATGRIHGAGVGAQQSAKRLEQTLLGYLISRQAFRHIQADHDKRELAMLARGEVDLPLQQFVEKTKLLQPSRLVSSAALLHFSPEGFDLGLMLLNLGQCPLQMHLALPLLGLLCPDRQQVARIKRHAGHAELPSPTAQIQAVFAVDNLRSMHGLQFHAPHGLRLVGSHQFTVRGADEAGLAALEQLVNTLRGLHIKPGVNLLDGKTRAQGGQHLDQAPRSLGTQEPGRRIGRILGVSGRIHRNK